MLARSVRSVREQHCGGAKQVLPNNGRIVIWARFCGETYGNAGAWLPDQKSSIIIEALLAGLEVEVLAEVRVQEGEPLENALRRFKRKVQQEDIIKEVKRHSYYLKPGEKRRVKAALARKRNRKKARKEQD